MTDHRLSMALDELKRIYSEYHGIPEDRVETKADESSGMVYARDLKGKKPPADGHFSFYA